jgi:hypothetical protein
MMSDELEQFEQRLRRQPLTSVPPEWRAEILAAARARQPQSACRTAPASSARAAFRDRLAAWLWPHPKAWAGVAAVWIVIAILQFSLRDEPAVRLAARPAPPSPELVAELRQQQKMFAELMGPAEVSPIDRQRSLFPRPRSERDLDRVSYAA